MNLSIFGFTLHVYGLIIGLAAVVAGFLAEYLAKTFYEEKYRKDLIWDSFWWVVGLGIVGARMYHVIDFWQYYREHVSEIFYVWNGGLGIYGGILGGVVGLWIYDRYVKKSEYGVSGYLDVMAPALLVAQAIGRWGNYFNQELYGKPTSLPWKLYISSENRLMGYENYEYFHPLFLYEMIWNLVGVVILYKLMAGGKLKFFEGNYFLVYLIWYGLGRSWLEYMRIEIWSLWGIPMASLVGVGIVVMSLLSLFTRRGK